MGIVSAGLLAYLFVATGCSNSDETRNRSKSRAPDYTQGEHYFKNAVKVDNEQVGPKMYRIENDEVICYVVHNGGADCQWKKPVGN